MINLDRAYLSVISDVSFGMAVTSIQTNKWRSNDKQANRSDNKLVWWVALTECIN